MASSKLNANRVTRKMVNDALRARGRDESLYTGEDYFFFGGGDAVHWLSSSVMVKKISVSSAKISSEALKVPTQNR
jgi:hypothetical protein